MANGDELIVGQVTGANSMTTLIGQAWEEDNDDYVGSCVFAVSYHGSDSNRLPKHRVDGINSAGIFGGTGVVGYGCDPRKNHGGVGVFGIGGTSQGAEFAHSTEPGAGVVGHGGEIRHDLPPEINSTAPHGPGVVGVGGAAFIPSHIERGSTGVFGQGGKAFRTTRPTPTGPSIPGAGVVGKGGMQSTDGQPSGAGGAGVVGVAGGVGLPPLDGSSAVGSGGVGVYGKGASRGGVLAKRVHTMGAARLRMRGNEAKAVFEILRTMGDEIIVGMLQQIKVDDDASYDWRYQQRSHKCGKQPDESLGSHARGDYRFERLDYRDSVEFPERNCKRLQCRPELLKWRYSPKNG